MVSDTTAQFEKVTGYGTVHDVPGLPAGLADVYESYFVPANGVRHHVVIGGSGAPLLLLGGWPQTWFAWRDLMLPLAKQFTVVVPDPRGMGLTDKATTGYDSGTLATDMIELMAALGYQRFAMVGHDIGAWTGYAMAADYPDRIARAAFGELIIPGVSPSPELIPDTRWLSDFLWHFNFNRTLAINETLVTGREEIYFGHQFDTKSGSPESVSPEARDAYIRPLKDPRALSASFEYYRSIDEIITQNHERKKHPIHTPMLAFAGTQACGDIVEKELRLVGDNLVGSIQIECGHYVMDENPGPLLEAVQDFLAPYAAEAQ